MATAIKMMILYPAYLNSNKTRDQGRRISKVTAVADPNVYEMAEVLKQLDTTVLLEPNKVYSRESSYEEPQFRGRIRIQPPAAHPELQDKQRLLVYISDGISKLNRKKFTQQSVTAVPEPAHQSEAPVKKSGRRNNRKK